MSQTFALNRTKDKEYELPCAGKCNTTTYHKVLASVDESGLLESWDYHYDINYQIVQCQGCRNVSFRKCETNSENVYYDNVEEAVLPYDHIELFPKRVEGHPNLSEKHRLPPKIALIYNETYAALGNGQPVLAGIGLRALVETVCKDKAAKGRNLEQQIDDLVSTGLLTIEGAEILHSLRVMGNAAAHEVFPHPEDDLTAALEVVEHLLNGVYVLPLVAKKLPQRTKSTP